MSLHAIAPVYAQYMCRRVFSLQPLSGVVDMPHVQKAAFPMFKTSTKVKYCFHSAHTFLNHFLVLLTHSNVNWLSTELHQCEIFVTAENTMNTAEEDISLPGILNIYMF